jgi:hypothetical protein
MGCGKRLKTMPNISPEEIKIKIAELQAAILQSHPTMPTLLQAIHRILKSDPENVTLMSEEDIGILVSGLKKQTMTEITTAVLKTNSKALKNTSLADL